MNYFIVFVLHKQKTVVNFENEINLAKMVASLILLFKTMIVFFIFQLS